MWVYGRIRIQLLAKVKIRCSKCASFGCEAKVGKKGKLRASNTRLVIEADEERSLFTRYIVSI